MPSWPQGQQGFAGWVGNRLSERQPGGHCIGRSGEADESVAIYVFGDSHAHYTFARCADVTTFWLGPRTMHRVGRDGASFVPHLVTPKPDDAVVLVFGEIDVRCHIARIARIQGRPIEYIIGELVDRYVVRTRATFEHFGLRSRIFMLGAPPPMDPITPNPDLPVHGPLSERIAIRRMLNAVLEVHTKAFDITYVPIPALYEEPDGSLRKRLSDGHAHIAMDHAHHICHEVGARIGSPLRFDRPVWLERICLGALRAWGFWRHDAEPLWDLGRLVYGRRRRAHALDTRHAERSFSPNLTR